jgi:hypothetical protein
VVAEEVEIAMASQRETHKSNEIPVTYLCWGCGSSKTVYEESNIPVPAQEVWNLCPNCILHNDTIKNSESIEQQPERTDLPETTIAIKQVEEVKEAVDATVSETNLPNKVTDLRIMLDNLSEEVESWRAWHKIDYLEVIETLKSQVEEIQNEWDNLSNSMALQREKLESLLQSFPGVIETATLKALTLRVAHLEELVSQLFSEA